MEQFLRWLVDGDVVGGLASPAESFWLVINATGIIVSFLAAILAVCDEARIVYGFDVRAESSAAVIRDRAGVRVLADVAARSEVIKANIHAGNAVVGIMVTLAPDPIRPSVSIALGMVTIWFIISSFLILWTTVITLKGRYDYRSVRGRARKTSWPEAVRLMSREVRTDVAGLRRGAWKRLRGDTKRR